MFHYNQTGAHETHGEFQNDTYLSGDVAILKSINAEMARCEKRVLVLQKCRAATLIFGSEKVCAAIGHRCEMQGATDDINRLSAIQDGDAYTDGTYDAMLVFDGADKLEDRFQRAYADTDLESFAIIDMIA